VFCSWLAIPASVVASPPPNEAVPISSRQIANFKIGSDQKTFGALEFVGGLELSSSNALFGAMSSIRFRADTTSFVAVLDTGHWLQGSVTRDVQGRLSGLADVTVTSMMDSQGRSERVKIYMDSEGLAFRDDEALVSFEQFHRVDAYPDPGFAQARPTASLPILIPERELRGNRGLETIAVSPAGSPLDGATVVVSELSFDKADHLYAAVLDGLRKGVFGVVQKDPFAITDGAFLPNGDLLLLERRFSFAEGIGMQIRRIAGDSIKAGAVVDGPVILSADMGYQIDNMEGLDVVALPDGEIRVIVVSDDNHSILERNLMLEFRLVQ